MTSATVIDCLSWLFCILGFPFCIHSDIGTPFVSCETHNFLTTRGINFSTSTPYHPQDNKPVRARQSSGLAHPQNTLAWAAVAEKTKYPLKAKYLHITVPEGGPLQVEYLLMICFVAHHTSE